jgi:hypothetical protein
MSGIAHKAQLADERVILAAFNAITGPANEHSNKAIIVLKQFADVLLAGPAHRYHDGDRQRPGVAAV